ncbi:3-phenylpropionate/cinnamic acid dioxygenase small subunit [Actinocorallia herbida]|uniref:3-phenylpropionate/cinnamic acid dioxygenase small subunit n=1 Tax=Actinocorallia herbida TaxID=58109 RepID=A0A3N1CUH4_9ACTN|nr:nuclear transport factor 2 family protein [Actinocorallia herbida]ROO84969.1 3-phenylpropionate/cinnamic acid dioxygenase small subunit [Actinocorallia herbida]
MLGDRRDVADELEIRGVLARVAQYSDTGDLDDYAALFTEDARWSMGDWPEKNGRAEIRAAGAARRAEGQTGPGSQSRHLVGTVAVALDGDRAVADSYWQFWVETAAEAPRLFSMGAYRDTLHRTGHGWRIAERVVTAG